MSFYWLLLGILSVWRLTHLFYAEDGPGDLFVKLRLSLGRGFWGRLLDCFYCLSLWIAAPFGLLLGASWGERFMIWLALSAGAILLNECIAPGHARPPVYLEDKESNHVMLRPKTTGASSETPQS